MHFEKRPGNFVSLFAGVGGFDLGMEKAGHRSVGQVEIDASCRQVLQKHWPKVARHDDVVTAKKWAYEKGLQGNVDFVCAGFPCQDVSIAGRRTGLSGARSGLFFDAVAFATYVEAEVVVLENVPGLLTSNKGRDFGVVLSVLADAGFADVEWRVLDSQFFGVPQRRRRLFVVASSGKHSRRAVLTELQSMSGNNEKGGKTEKKAAGKTAETFAERSYGITGRVVGRSDTAGPNGQSHTPENGPMFTLTNNDRHVVAFNTQSKETFRMLGHGHYLNDNTASTIKARDYKDATDLVALSDAQVLAFDTQFGSNANVFLNQSPTLKASQQAPSILKSVVRRLTPVECERLQGFPDGWTDGQTNTQRYKQMGNAVTVNVIEWIGERLQFDAF
jgi:DNA (cytosine-5)-methyltransferase 1